MRGYKTSSVYAVMLTEVEPMPKVPPDKPGGPGVWLAQLGRATLDPGVLSLYPTLCVEITYKYKMH